MRVHNHGLEEVYSCKEYLLPDGSMIGTCLMSQQKIFSIVLESEADMILKIAENYVKQNPASWPGDVQMEVLGAHGLIAEDEDWVAGVATDYGQILFVEHIAGSKLVDVTKYEHGITETINWE